jgi:hypothetical protein
MIRLERHEEIKPAVWRYTVPCLNIEGRSHQPLLDACRQLKRMGVGTTERVQQFRAGHTEPDATCSVGWGAAHTVWEPSNGTVHFARYEGITDTALQLLRTRKGNRHQ